ncbi:carbohydrate ABC transporter substrate-binding protein [Paenibacillaceae bacterium]|nr:carbohydrate ABC transporter substrate-binding protein [Paenibacillaceae bacterium]
MIQLKKIGLLMMLSIMLLVSACSGNGGGVSPSAPGGDSNGDPKGVTEGGPKTVVISVMHKDRFLESAAQKFEEKHKNIRIEIKEYKASEDMGDSGLSMQAISLADVEKYVQSVTTQVMSGKGSDLILMSELPQDKFVDKKLLIDLNELLAKDSTIDRNALYTNILKASQDGDGLYAMPISFSLELFQGDTELLKKANISVDPNEPWNWEQFMEVAEKLKLQGDSEKLINLDPTSLLFDYIEDNYAELVGQGKPNFDSDLFRNKLKEIKSMYDEGLLSDGMSFDGGQAVFRMAGIYSPEQALTMPDGLDYYQKPGTSGKNNGAPFKPMYSWGINSKSNVQEEAWAFIAFMLSDEMQASPNLAGLAMNKAATNKKLKEVAEKIESGTLETMMPQNMLPSGETAKARVEAVEKQIAGTNFRRFSDMKVLIIALEEFNTFMSGQKSAEDVSKLIQNRVTTYLNE